MATPTKFFLFLSPILLIVAFVFSFHVIRVDTGIEILPKDTFTHKDFYVDVRGFGLADYFYHAPKIRNYLFFQKPYNKFLNLIEEKKAELETPRKDEDKPRRAFANTLEQVETDVRKWLEIIRR